MIIPQIRTISAAAEHFKMLDPNTCITQHRIRAAVLNGSIPHIKAGAKYLINLDFVADYFTGQPPQEQPQQQPLQQGIRAVAP